MIPFNKPPYLGTEDALVIEAIHQPKIAGDGHFSRQCEAWFEKHLSALKTLMTTSCTHALEMAAMLIEIKPGDEVIMPSYTFVSTANAFVLHGAKIVFVDIRPDTMNIDETKIETAITSKTKAIVPVHYAGVGCEMDTIMDIALRYNLWVVEDAAQGMMSTYKEKALGTIGHLGTYSFHETKNYTSGGEGGVLIINDEALIEKAEIIREKGTNRKQFFRGEVDKYSWVGKGSSYLPSELQCAYLHAQQREADKINDYRLNAWHYYYHHLKPIEKQGFIELPTIPDSARHNAHIFYLKVADLQTRTALLQHLKDHHILSVFHYVPLHSSPAGKMFGIFHGTDRYTTKESERLIRLPMYYGLTQTEQQKVIDCVFRFYQ